jgi:predicted nucleic acid-binding protein
LLNRAPTIPQEQLTALKAVYEDMLDGKLWIVTSSLFRAEVFGPILDARSQAIYDNLQACPYFEIVEIRSSAYEVVGDIRKNLPKGQTLKTADALHIVMAGQAGVKEMWTTEKSLVNKSKNGHLGTVAVVYPHLDQQRILFET